MADEEQTKTYIVGADAQVLEKFDAQGRTVDRKRYRKGDKIELTEAQAFSLKRFPGAILDVDAEPEARNVGPDRGESEPGDWANDGPGRGDTGGGGERFPNQGFRADEEKDQDREPVTGPTLQEGVFTSPAVPDDEKDHGPEGADSYDAMSYPDLQQLAKRRTGSGAGSKDDLVERLKEHDGESSSKDDDEDDES